MDLRPATLYDVPALLLLVRKVIPLMQAQGNTQWDEAYPNAEVFIDDINDGQLWIADVDGAIAGVAAITIDQYPEYAQAGLDINEHAIVVHRLAVDPEFRGMGIATALMEHAEAIALQAGIGILRGDTSAENAAARSMFPRLGYNFMGEMDLGFRPGRRFVCYEKRLQAGQDPSVATAE